MPNISLALSGSGFRFSCHVGVIKALEEVGYNITEIAGTSGGGIISSLYAYGLDADKLLNISKGLPYGDFVSPSINSLFSFTGWNNGSAMESALRNIVGIATFNDLLIPCSIIATNLIKQNSFVFSQHTTPDESILVADRCTSAVPFIYSYVDYKNMVLVDGGVSDDLPVNYLTDPTNIKLAIQLIEDEPINKPTNLVDIASLVIDSVLKATSRGYLNSPNIKLVNIVTPSGYSFKADMNQNDVEMLYELGYEATKQEIAKW